MVVPELVLPCLPEQLAVREVQAALLDRPSDRLGARLALFGKGFIAVPLVRVDAVPAPMAADARDKFALVAAVAVEPNPVLASAVRGCSPIHADAFAQLVLRHGSGPREVGKACIARSRVDKMGWLQLEGIGRLVERRDIGYASNEQAFALLLEEDLGVFDIASKTGRGCDASQQVNLTFLTTVIRATHIASRTPRLRPGSHHIHAPPCLGSPARPA